MTFQLSRKERRAAVRHLREERARQPEVLAIVPSDQWPKFTPPLLVRVWRSRAFLVQEFEVPNASVLCRLSINRTEIDGDRWSDNISWDELQRIKREAGYGDRDAVEVYPADADIVNVANIRHLWILIDALSFKWRQP